MAANLVSVVMQFLTPDMIAKIASALGLDRSVAQKAIGGAVPALLAGLADLASNPHGARQLSNTLAQQQPGSLESLKGLIGSSGQNNLAETGSNMLSGLFGGGALDTMAQSIGKFAGIGYQTGWAGGSLTYRYLSFEQGSSAVIQHLSVKGPMLMANFTF